MGIKEEDIAKKGKKNAPVSGKGVSVEKILVENFVSLQKVMTNLALKFDSLSEQMSKLLELFEISAKALAEKGYPDEEDRKMMEKLDSLLEHNKVIAKGIALLHEKGENEKEEEEMMPRQEFQKPSALPDISMPVQARSGMGNFPKPLPVPRPALKTGE